MLTVTVTRRFSVMNYVDAADFVSSLHIKEMNMPLDTNEPPVVPTEYELCETEYRYEVCQVCLQKHSRLTFKNGEVSKHHEQLIAACSQCSLLVHPGCLNLLSELEPRYCLGCQVASINRRT